MKIKQIFLLLLTASGAFGFEVIIALPCTIKSLNALFFSLAKALGDRGHRVTFVTPFKSGEHPNVTYVDIKGADQVSEFNVFHKTTTLTATNLFIDVTTRCTQYMWTDPGVIDLWNNRNKFDLFITSSLISEMAFPFLMENNIPAAQFCTPAVEYSAIAVEGNWLPLSVIPCMVDSFDNVMSFWDRVLNVPCTAMRKYIFGSAYQATKREVEKFFPTIGDLDSYFDRISLTLINGHFAMDGPVPLLPSQVEIGTINAKKPKPLPKDLEDFMKGSGEEGVIYFSLGSIAKSAHIPQNVKLMFLDAFKQLPQNILWKYEGDDLQLPPNVMTKGWIPQQDVLGHPKTRVFISHCGNQGTQEAKYHGVPVLGVPVAFDQHRNAARMERRGFAIVLSWESMTTQSILEALKELLHNPEYSSRMKEISRIVKDQKDSPAERAVWWLEYLVRHKGAPQLQYAGRRLSVFQYAMLDVIAFWGLVLTLILCSPVIIVWYFCCSRKRSDGNKAKKEKKTNKTKKE